VSRPRRLANKAEIDAEGNRVGCQEHRFPSRLEIKYGMPVILLANIDVDAGLVNGSQGRVVGFSAGSLSMKAREQKLAQSGEFSRFEEHQITSWAQQQTTAFLLPVVRFENDVQQIVYPVCQDTELGDPPPFSVVARTQIPLLPAWAITIHKSQGMTLEKAVVNVEHIFEPQMAYVALSRVRSLEGLKVVSNVSLETLQERGRLGRGDEAVRAFMQEQTMIHSVGCIDGQGQGSEYESRRGERGSLHSTGGGFSNTAGSSHTLPGMHHCR
jgi:ATP-dependent DNA helicase PIF1